MKKRAADFAALGGDAEFALPLHVAQINLPPWDDLAASFRGIFARRYFANHGPLVRELDLRFAEVVGARHAICVTNGTVALMILARALQIEGEVIVPAFTFPATLQAVLWAGLTPVIVDVDPATQMLSAQGVEAKIGPRTAAIAGVHAWGRPCDPAGLEDLARRHGLALYFDACHGIACAHRGRRIGTFGDAEAFSFHATKIVNGAEGGCITTDDDGLASRLRTIRSFHPSETFAEVPVRMNGKMSEAQAAVALLSLDELDRNIAANRRRFERYRQGLRDLRGIRLLDLEQDGDTNNFQYVVLDVDEAESGLSRDRILDVLAAENVICRRHFWPGLHRQFPRFRHPADAFEATERLVSRVMQLPNSQSMSLDDVDRVCALLRDTLRWSAELRRRSS